MIKDITFLMLAKNDKKSLLFAIFKQIKKIKTKYLCIFNTNGNSGQRESKNMYKIIKLLDYDYDFASRYGKDCSTEDDKIVTKIRNYFLTKLVNVLFKLKITDIFYIFFIRVISSSKKINLKKKDFSFCVELPIKAKAHGMKIISSNSYERKRIAGIKKVNAVRDGTKILVSMIGLFFKNK